MFVIFEADMMMTDLCFSRDDEEDDAKKAEPRAVFAPVKRAAATAAAANGGGNTRVRIKDAMVGVQNVCLEMMQKFVTRG